MYYYVVVRNQFAANNSCPEIVSSQSFLAVFLSVIMLLRGV
jgi:hypothetical protein